MKTIEERATIYALKSNPYSPYFEATREEYIKFAIEQKTEDIDKACNIFCHIGCPHKTDDYDCLKDKCAAWKKFRRMMEE